MIAERAADSRRAVPGPTPLLLQVCCAPCSTAVVEQLQQAGYAPTLYFCNPNIHPLTEYQQRRAELQRWCSQQRLPLLLADDRPADWFAAIAGLENQPERGRRCHRCFRLRLQLTALCARRHGFGLFGTALTVSPHKDAVAINRLGQALGRQLGLEFFVANFKKQGGFQRSLELSRQYGFYRQRYCGCQFSLQQRQRQDAAQAAAGDHGDSR
ncbi:epoxyqueuosine reductase QueH [Desulfuromonas thiophila]|uniref:epoxyqueuosine reductase QueH n=1 Tax=Desulfuromonas thiophila TaxID=57664 RepID=UPI0024A7B290|nr:epoxyqueuosine reductase QueH [Desulfuromonas thiophila]